MHLDRQGPGSDELSLAFATGEKTLLLYNTIDDTIASHFTEEDVTIDERHDFLKEK